MRVALCLYGLVGGDKGKGGAGDSSRTLAVGHKHYKKHMMKTNDQVDVFVHTWSADQKKEIDGLYKPKKSVYEKQIQFKVPKWVTGTPQRKNNHYSKWYSTMRAVELKREYEKQEGFEYDFVITSRFDIALTTDFDFSKHDPEEFHAGEWCQMLNSKGTDVFKGGRGPLYDWLAEGKNPGKLTHKHIGYPHTEEGFIDQWFFSNSRNMDKFANLYNLLDEYTKPGNCPTDSANTISNHRLSLYHVQRTGLLPKLKFVHHLYDDFPLVRRKFLGCKL